MGSWKWLRDTHPVARRPHVCLLCELEIPRGELHCARSGVEDGRVVKVRMHNACETRARGWSDDEWQTNDPAAFRDDLERDAARGGE